MFLNFVGYPQTELWGQFLKGISMLFKLINLWFPWFGCICSVSNIFYWCGKQITLWNNDTTARKIIIYIMIGDALILQFQRNKNHHGYCKPAVNLSVSLRALQVFQSCLAGDFVSFSVPILNRTTFMDSCFDIIPFVCSEHYKRAHTNVLMCTHLCQYSTRG